MNFKVKSTYLFIGAVLVLSACSQQDDMPGFTDVEGRRIVFRTSLPDLVSRAEIITGEKLSYFQVTAYDQVDKDTLFSNARINIDADKDFYSSPNCIWPKQGKENNRVSFFAFYPGLEELGRDARLPDKPTAGSLDYKLTGFSIAPDIADQVDFITAYTSGTMAENQFSGIDLPFVHQLSRIEIKAYGAHKSCDIEIAGVRIGGTGVEGTFDFKPINGTGEWSGTPTRGIVEYVYCKGDTIVTCGKHHPIEDVKDAVSIMGKKHKDGNENCAMLIPGNYDQWDYANDRRNGSNQMYISVLIRITDATLTAGINPVDKQRYPYRDLSQGADSYEIPKEYFAVNKTTGVVSDHIYKNEKGYFADSKCTDLYTLEASDEIKEFGWAALPIKGNWVPGNIYTYTLDYTVGVGLHDPAVTTTAPAAGDAIISDKVGISYNVTEWKTGGGSSYVVPGS